MPQEKTDLTYQQMGDCLIQEAVSGNLPAVRRLIERGADINFANIDAFTPLMAAAQWRQLNVLKFLLENGARLVPVAKTNGRTALMHACLSGSPQCVELLLEAGARVNVRDSYGMTALMMAATTGGTEMVRPLLQAGAEIDARDDQGFTAVDWAAKWGRTDIIDLISLTRSSSPASMRSQAVTATKSLFIVRNNTGESHKNGS